MKRDDLVRALRRYARKNDLAFDLDKARGKGAHYRVRLGKHVTTIQGGELSPFHVKRICDRLGLHPDAIR